MASPSSLFLVAIAITLVFSQAQSQTCTSSPFSSNFTSCQVLPTLGATIHYTYIATARPNPTLSIAFSAAPAQPGGWVAWALNPTGTGMAGSQSFIAFRDTNGSIVVRTYNISSYSSIVESRLSYNVLTSRAEFSNGTMRIFATLALPVGGRSELNQVWQVGSAVTNGAPARHAFDTANLNSRNTLQLDGATVDSPAPSPANTPSGGGGRNGAPAPNGVSATLVSGFVLYGSLVVIGAMILGF